MSDPGGDALLGEILAAKDAGVKVDDYCAMRAAGADHDEALEVGKLGVSGSGYREAIAVGMTHQEVTLVARSTTGMTLSEVAEGVREGLSVGEIGLAALEYLDVNNYRTLRAVGVSHREALEAHRTHPRGVPEYLIMRRDGVGHKRAMRMIKRAKRDDDGKLAAMLDGRETARATLERIRMRQETLDRLDEIVQSLAEERQNSGGVAQVGES